MPADARPNPMKQPVRKPLYGSIWMAFFALLWEGFAQPRGRPQS